MNYLEARSKILAVKFVVVKTQVPLLSLVS